MAKKIGDTRKAGKHPTTELVRNAKTGRTVYTGVVGAKKAKGVQVTRVPNTTKKGEVKGEAWRVTTDKGPATVITSPSSAAAMDEAVEIYSEALKRLAKR